MAEERRIRTAREQLPELPREVMELLLEVPTRGRFEAPWRSGINAARVPYWYLRLICGAKHTRLADRPAPTRHETATVDQMSIIWIKLQGSSAATEMYEEAGRLIAEAEATYYRPIIYCFARVVQLYLSSSHGGGHSYNVLLERLQSESTGIDEPFFEEAIKEARCLDAIGTDFMMKNDHFDEVRAAFLTLWKGGHYRLIYSLPSAKELTE